MKMVFSGIAITFAAVHSIKSLWIPITGTAVLLCFLLLIIILKMENLDVLFCPMKQSHSVVSLVSYLSGTKVFLGSKKVRIICFFKYYYATSILGSGIQ